jgi:hypothetical protein
MLKLATEPQRTQRQAKPASDLERIKPYILFHATFTVALGASAVLMPEVVPIIGHRVV